MDLFLLFSFEMPDFLFHLVDWMRDVWHYVVAFVITALTIVTSLHAVLYKRDTRATMGWVGVILLSPVIGSLLYMFLGVNRIRRKAANVRQDHLEVRNHEAVTPTTYEDLCDALPPDNQHIAEIIKPVQRLVQRPLLPGNRFTPLFNGDQAYPQMLKSISQAQKTVCMSSYIFDDDASGQQFHDALADAVKRGVEVRVLIDAVGARYSFPAIDYKLKRSNIPTARFLPTLLPSRVPYMNLRNHRKLLIVDGTIGYTGGMNIREGNELQRNPSHPIQDLHFKIQGPVVTHLQEAFAEDWNFSTQETLEGPEWFPPLKPVGETFARGISDGPDEDQQKLYWVLHGAIACAKHSIRIASPYFLPDDSLLSALNTAAMRDIKVEIIIPAANNVKLVEWASRDQIWQLINQGCKVYTGPLPFDHTKLFVIDETWCVLGSANMDPRSLRLNFEFTVECYDPKLAQEMHAHLGTKIEQGQAVTLAQLEARPMFARIRDGFARLLSPYL